MYILSYWKVSVLLLSLLLLLQLEVIVSASRLMTSVAFGPFYVSTHNVDTKCSSGGRPLDKKSELRVKMTVKKVARYKELFYGNITIPNDIYNFTSFLITTIWRDGGYYLPFYTKTYNQPCKSKFMKHVLFTYLNVDEKCFLKKGNYTISVEPNELVHNAVGNKFFYEKFSLEVVIHSPRGQVACVKLAYQSRPLTKAQKAMNQTFRAYLD